jgi:hypothetical protein
MSVIVSLWWFQWSIILKRIQSGGDLELSPNELLVILEIMLRIGESFLEQPDFPTGVGEVKVVRVFVSLRGVGWLVLISVVRPVVRLQL